MALFEFNENFYTGGSTPSNFGEVLKYIIPLFTALFAFWLGRRGAKSNELKLEEKTYDAFIDEVQEIKPDLVFQIKDLYRWINTLELSERDHLNTPLTHRLWYAQSLDRKLVTAYTMRAKNNNLKKSIRATFNSLAVLDNQAKLLIESLTKYEEKINLKETVFFDHLKKLNENLVEHWNGDDKNIGNFENQIAQFVHDNINTQVLKDARTLRPALQHLLNICSQEVKNPFALSTAKILAIILDKLSDVEMDHIIFKDKFKNILNSMIICFFNMYPDSEHDLIPEQMPS